MSNELQVDVITYEFENVPEAAVIECARHKPVRPGVKPIHFAQHRLREKEFFYMPSMSSRMIVYKGLLLAPQISDFYKELRDADTRSSLCMVHQRFSTNTFPTWPLAHPYRMIYHNGEINTVRGNVNWMNARESVLKSDLFGEDLAKTFPVIRPGGSDTACLDNAVETLRGIKEELCRYDVKRGNLAPLGCRVGVL